MDTSIINEYLGRISKEDITQAMKKLDITVIPNKRQSSTYDVINPTSNKKYPPPLLIEYAYKISNSDNLPIGFFNNIGMDSLHFRKLNDLGFIVVPKNNTKKTYCESIF